MMSSYQALIVLVASGIVSTLSAVIYKVSETLNMPHRHRLALIKAGLAFCWLIPITLVILKPWTSSLTIISSWVDSASVTPSISTPELYFVSECGITFCTALLTTYFIGLCLALYRLTFQFFSLSRQL